MKRWVNLVAAPILAILVLGSQQSVAQHSSPVPGQKVSVGRMTVVVPSRGHAVEAYGEFADGTSELLVVRTDLNGE